MRRSGRKVSFKCRIEDDALHLQSKDNLVIIDMVGRVTTGQCPYWVLTAALEVQNTFYSAANSIAQKEEANTVDVFNFLVKGFSPTFAKKIKTNYERDEFTIGIVEDVAYTLPKSVYELITQYENASQERTNIFFPDPTIRSYDDTKYDFNIINEGLDEEDQLSLTSFLNADYIVNWSSQILFGTKKQQYL